MPVRRSAWSLSRVAWFSIGQPPHAPLPSHSIQDRAGFHAPQVKAFAATPATADGPDRFAASTSRFESGRASIAQPACRPLPTALRHTYVPTGLLREPTDIPSPDR